MSKIKIFTKLIAILLLFSFLTTPVTAASSIFRASTVDRVISEAQPLPADYKPIDLVRAVDFGVVTKKDPNIDEMKIRLVQDTTSNNSRANLPSHLRDLMYACEQKTGEVSQLGSGYRSYDKQRIVYWNHRYDGQAALPGTSEHQSGLAVDIAVNGKFLTAKSATYKCFGQQAWQDGFILSFPVGNDYLQGRQITEPWHWRYVGLPAARLLHKFGKKDYPAEFLAKLHYFRWLDENNLTETIPALRQALARLAELKETNDIKTWIFGRQVKFMSQRIMREVAVR